MNLPADEQANPKTVKRPAGCLSGGVQEEPGPFESWCLRCSRRGVFMASNALCDDCEEEGRQAEADAEFERKRAYWRPLYEGEKLAGLVRDKDFAGVLALLTPCYVLSAAFADDPSALLARDNAERVRENVAAGRALQEKLLLKAALPVCHVGVVAHFTTQ